MDIKNQIIGWFNGPQDYDEGLELLRQVTKKRKVLGKLFKGESKTRRAKLAYEHSRAVGLRTIPEPKAVKGPANLVPSGNKAPSTANDKKEKVNAFPERLNLLEKGEDINDYPEKIKALVNEYSSKYKERGKLHRKFTSLGDSNSEEKRSERKKMADEIKELSTRLEFLHEAFQGYKNSGVILDINPDKKGSGSGEEGGEKEQTIEDLKKLKKNLQANLAKDRNMLKYQSKARPEDGKANPMPDCPKKKKILKRIAAREQEIKEIDDKIVDLE